MGYSWEAEGSGGGMSSTGAADFGSARKAYKDESSGSGSRSRKSSDSGSGSRRSESVGSKKSKDEESFKRSYPEPEPGATPRPLGLTIATESTHPIVVLCDDTGSMDEWPIVIREKLALLGKEAERYAPDYALSFAFVGDTRCDRHGLQIHNFDKGPALEKDHLRKLYFEGNGGDNEESYGVAAYYYLKHSEIPKAVKPILIFILDATDHDDIQPREVREYIGDVLNVPLSTKDVFKQLGKKYRVYIVSVHGNNREYWSDMVGAQHFIPIEEPRDVVEILIGIVAGELGEFKDFEMRSSGRHSDKPDRVSRVEESLKSVKKTSEKMASGKAAAAGDAGVGEKSKSMKSKKLV
jgi:hypothetical protein